MSAHALHDIPFEPRYQIEEHAFSVFVDDTGRLAYRPEEVRIPPNHIGLVLVGLDASGYTHLHVDFDDEPGFVFQQMTLDETSVLITDNNVQVPRDDTPRQMKFSITVEDQSGKRETLDPRIINQ